MIILAIAILYYLICWRLSVRRLIEVDKRSYTYSGIDTTDVVLDMFISTMVCPLHGPYSVVARRLEKSDTDPNETFVNLISWAVGVDKPSRSERKQAKIKRLEKRNQELERELGLHQE